MFIKTKIWNPTNTKSVLLNFTFHRLFRWFLTEQIPFHICCLHIITYNLNLLHETIRERCCTTKNSLWTITIITISAYVYFYIEHQFHTSHFSLHFIPSQVIYYCLCFVTSHFLFFHVLILLLCVFTTSSSYLISKVFDTKKEKENTAHKSYLKGEKKKVEERAQRFLANLFLWRLISK